MWLGVAAAFSGIFYALAKFATAFWLRRLREAILQSQHEVTRNDQRLTQLAERLGVQQSRQRTLARETGELRAVTDRLYVRLAAMLPQSLLAELERCRDLHAEPATREFRLLQDLALVEEVNRALGPLSLLLLLPAEGDEEGKAMLVGRLTQLLADEAVPHKGPDEGVYTCFFPRPDGALDLLHRLTAGAPPHQADGLRAALHAGLAIPDETGEIHQILARNLLRARRLLERALPGTVLMNAEAVQPLAARDGIESFEPDPRFYVFTWVEPDELRDAEVIAA
ncbi:MAG: hypothetical protein WDA75_13510 [Candidatus Latescibacterota bacterium]